MTLNESPEGKALIFCHAGCTAPEIAQALGLRMADLFPEKPPKIAEIGPAGRWRATYPYHDADGEVLFEVVRFDNAGNKTFRRRRPLPNGGWVWNTNGVPNVPYHLPQVRRAVDNGETLIVVEGEKDAENVPWAFGITATCNAGGAGKWQPEHTLAVAGAAKVVVIADDDRPGHLHAAAVLRALTGHVGDVRACLPAVGCKDITEHLKAGYGKDALRAVTLAELDYVDGEVEEGEPLVDLVDLSLAHIIDWSAAFAGDHAEETWVAEPLIPAGRAVALYAPAKAGKSSVVLAMVAAVAAGRPVFGQWTCEPTSVLYLDYEMTESDVIERLIELGYDADDLANLHYALLPSLPPLDTADGAQAVLELALHFDAQIVVVDTFGRAVEGGENDADTVRSFYRHTGLALKAAGRAVLRADHSGKELTKGQRGSSAKADDVDVVWQLTRTDKGTTLKRTHSRISWVPDQIILERLEDGERVTWKPVAASYPEGTKAVAEDLDSLDVPVDISVRAACKRLREAGKGRRPEIVGPAVKWRKEIAMAVWGSGNAPGNSNTEPPRETLRETDAKALQETPGKRPETPSESPWETMSLPQGETLIPETSLGFDEDPQMF